MAWVCLAIGIAAFLRFKTTERLTPTQLELLPQRVLRQHFPICLKPCINGTREMISQQ